MLQMQAFLRDDVFPSWFANALTKAMSVAASQFQLIKLDATHIQLVASANGGAAVLSVAGLWRWVEASLTVAHPGGTAGTYPIFATAKNNNITASPLPYSDATDYSFQLVILAPGATPTITPGVVDVFRQVGNAIWDGAQITRVDQLVPAPTTHAGRHATGGTDPLTPAMIGGVAVADPSTAQPGDYIFSAATTRAGALLCDGSAYSRATYAALFAAIGTTAGAGDGTTTFNVPDFRDKAPVGASATRTRGGSSGAATAALTAANLPAHLHGYSATTAPASNDHSHTYSGTTGTDSPDHAHGPGSGSLFVDSINIANQPNVATGGGSTNMPSSSAFSGAGATAGANARHAHGYSGTTSGVSATHTHTVSGNTDNGSGLSATPFSLYQPSIAVNVFIKT